MRARTKQYIIVLGVFTMTFLLANPAPGISQQESECIHLDCKRRPLEASRDGYCIFHVAGEEKEVREFREALRDYLNEIKTKNLDYDFRDFIFVGDINFKRNFKVTVFKNVDFSGAEFHGDARFWGAEFQGDANFEEIKFHKAASFADTEFHGNAQFSGAEFHGDVSFRRTVEFHKYARFSGAEFRADAGFWGAKFDNEVAFWDAKFRGITSFRGTEFHGDVFLDGVKFWARAYISPKFIKRRVSFINADLENISLTSLNLDKNAWIDFRGARLKNTDIRRKDIEGHIRQELQKDFSEAKEIYRLLKNNFRGIGRYHDEGWAFKKEKDMERQSYLHAGSLLQWGGSTFLNFLCGYGERPLRVIISAGVVIVIFAFLFMIFGITTSEKVESRFKNAGWRNFFTCLYFSTVTFTTLGYGDFRPLKGRSRFFAGVEAFTGAFMIALFVYTFVRATGGR